MLMEEGQPLSIGFVEHLQRGKSMHDVFLQILGFVPASILAGNGTTTSSVVQTFLVSVSDSLHSDFVQLEESLIPMISRNELQAGQVVHIRTIERSFPCPVAKGIEILSAPQSCIGRPVTIENAVVDEFLRKNEKTPVFFASPLEAKLHSHSPSRWLSSKQMLLGREGDYHSSSGEDVPELDPGDLRDPVDPTTHSTDDTSTPKYKYERPELSDWSGESASSRSHDRGGDDEEDTQDGEVLPMVRSAVRNTCSISPQLRTRKRIFGSAKRSFPLHHRADTFTSVTSTSRDAEAIGIGGSYRLRRGRTASSLSSPSLHAKVKQDIRRRLSSGRVIISSSASPSASSSPPSVPGPGSASSSPGSPNQTSTTSLSERKKSPSLVLLSKLPRDMKEISSRCSGEISSRVASIRSIEEEVNQYENVQNILQEFARLMSFFRTMNPVEVAREYLVFHRKHFGAWERAHRSQALRGRSDDILGTKSDILNAYATTHHPGMRMRTTHVSITTTKMPSTKSHGKRKDGLHMDGDDLIGYQHSPYTSSSSSSTSQTKTRSKAKRSLSPSKSGSGKSDLMQEVIRGGIRWFSEFLKDHLEKADAFLRAWNRHHGVGAESRTQLFDFIDDLYDWSENSLRYLLSMDAPEIRADLELIKKFLQRLA
eukprot:TRINITY_DN2922_c0_g1_i1.p1 TRINITY_DN2922_c0_g1~~TRINITY_DN2922_c0_g1_i1.p1  ORF type:complete len:653 (-),score=177.39 TRINITY_DN2922_c0_g1_i1:21-1979(-)